MSTELTAKERRLLKRAAARGDAAPSAAAAASSGTAPAPTATAAVVVAAAGDDGAELNAQERRKRKRTAEAAAGTGAAGGGGGGDGTAASGGGGGGGGGGGDDDSGLNAAQRRKKARAASRGADNPAQPGHLISQADDRDGAAGEAGAAGAGGDGSFSMPPQQRLIVFLGQLPFSATEASVRAHFAAVGECKIRMRTDRKTKKFLGTAFLEVSSEEQMTAVLRLHHSLMDRRRINVERSAKGGGNSRERVAAIKGGRKQMQKSQVAHVRRTFAAVAKEMGCDATHANLDDRAFDFLAWFDRDTARKATEEFFRMNLKKVINHNAFLMGILKRYRTTDGVEEGDEWKNKFVEGSGATDYALAPPPRDTAKARRAAKRAELNENAKTSAFAVAPGTTMQAEISAAEAAAAAATAAYWGGGAKAAIAPAAAAAAPLTAKERRMAKRAVARGEPAPEAAAAAAPAAAAPAAPAAAPAPAAAAAAPLTAKERRMAKRAAARGEPAPEAAAGAAPTAASPAAAPAAAAPAATAPAAAAAAPLTAKERRMAKRAAARGEAPPAQ